MTVDGGWPGAPLSSDSWGDPDRSYNMGINGRGQRLLKDIQCIDRLYRYSVPVRGRFTWSEGNKTALRIFTDRTATSRIIQRDRLASLLYEEITDKYPQQIQVAFNTTCTNLEAANDGRLLVQVNNSTATHIHTHFVVGADGARSFVRDGLGFSAVRFPESNTRVYKIMPLKLPKDMRMDLDYIAGRPDGVALDALPTPEGNMIGVVLFRPEDTQVASLNTAESVRRYVRERFAAVVPYIEEEQYALFAKRKTCSLPSFSYAAGPLHRTDPAPVVLLGDAIHCVKPYFGQGVNSAFEDVEVLQRCLQECGDDLRRALPLYTKRRAPQAKALVELSRSFDKDPRSPSGFLLFVLPLILDGIFHNLMPRLFATNPIALMQNDDLTFTGIRRRKRLDRLGQVALMAAVVTAVGRTITLGLKTLLFMTA
mmetsp:Transcript_15756/g.44928  ORF Transcript_15756/g.44928 Transcript_15756/m.44928 type:complete len:425 (+) Transcript_15756:139-1413(+)